MQTYGPAFARVYNAEWVGFVNRVAPKILEFYESTPLGKEHTSVLDLCCGTGQLAVYFLEKGFHAVGIDLSDDMLLHAQENARQYIESGLATFLRGDATDFSLDEQFGMVVSTFDSINHLADEKALRGCFQSVFSALVDEGYFIFDLSTRKGLKNWNFITVTDNEEMMIVNRGIYDGEGPRALMKVSGFIRSSNGLYERFDETMFNTVFEMELVKTALLETGWSDVLFTRIGDLTSSISEPEEENRVFVVARK